LTLAFALFVLGSVSLDGSLCEPLDLTELQTAMAAKTVNGTLKLECESSRVSMTLLRADRAPLGRQFLLEGETPAERVQLLMLLADELLALDAERRPQNPAAPVETAPTPRAASFSEVGFGVASTFTVSQPTLLLGPRIHLRFAAGFRFFVIAEGEALFSFVSTNLGALSLQSFGGAFGLGISQRWTALECAAALMVRGGILRAEGMPVTPDIEKQTVSSPWIGPALSGTVSYALSPRLRVRGSFELGTAVSGAAVTATSTISTERYGVVGIWVSAGLAVAHFW
jgi:hypothetical protein